MKKLLLIMLIVLSISAGAQEYAIGMQGGLNFTNITGGNFYLGTGLRMGMNAGLTYEWQSSGKMRLGVDVLYSEQGYISYGTMQDKPGMETGVQFNVKNNFDYLAVPIKIGYTIGEKIKVIPRLGIVTSYLLKAETKIPGIYFGGQYFEPQTNKINNLRKYDFAGLAELGVEFKLSDHLLFEPNITYKHSFSGIYAEDLIGIDMGELRHYGFAASVGVRYSFQ